MGYGFDEAYSAAAAAIAATRPDSYKLYPASLQKWRFALAKARSSTYRPKLAFVGDSTTWGQGGGTGANGLVAGRLSSYPAIFKNRLSNFGLTGTVDNLFGDGGFADQGGNLPTGDARITYGAGWSGDNSLHTLGGGLIKSSTTSSVLTIAPTGAFDTITLYYVGASANGTVDVAFDGGSATSINSANGTVAILSTTLTTTLATHTLTLTVTSSGKTFFLLGFDAYNSAASDVRVWNMGWRGATSVNVSDAASAYNSLPMLGTMAPDLTVINLGINDWRLGASISSFQTAIQAIITKAKLSGDAVLVAPLPSAVGGASVATQATFNSALKALADSNGIPLFDMTARFGSQAAASSFYYDTFHGNAAAYADMGSFFANMLLSA